MHDYEKKSYLFLIQSFSFVSIGQETDWQIGALSVTSLILRLSFCHDSRNNAPEAVRQLGPRPFYECAAAPLPTAV